MNLHIYIAGKECANYSVHPIMVPKALRYIDDRLEEMKRRGKVVVTLDSVEHKNLSYLLYPRPTA